MAKEPEAHHYDVPVDRLHQAVLDAVAERGLGKVQQVSWGEAGRVATKLKQGVDAALATG
jgi:hypothetical protein